MADSEVVSWPTAVELFQPDIVVGNVSSWDVADRIVPGVADDWTSVGDPTFDAYVLDEYAVATEILTETGAELFWLQSSYLNRDLLPDDHRSRVDGINALVAAAVDSLPERAVTLVDYQGWIARSAANVMSTCATTACISRVRLRGDRAVAHRTAGPDLTGRRR